MRICELVNNLICFHVTLFTIEDMLQLGNRISLYPVHVNLLCHCSEQNYKSMLLKHACVILTVFMYLILHPFYFIYFYNIYLHLYLILKTERIFFNLKLIFLYSHNGPISMSPYPYVMWTHQPSSFKVEIEHLTMV